MKKKMKLAEVATGANFEVWGHEYTILDKTKTGVFCLETTAITEMTFESDSEIKNNFRTSNICIFLQSKYLYELKFNGASDNDILPFEIDLKCTLGQHEYGKHTVKVGLLTLEQYGKYYHIIPKTDTWWLATPWMTPKYSPITSDSTYAWIVGSNGYVNYSFCSNSYGVRPALTLSHELLVTVECKEDDNFDKQLWSEYIKYLHRWAVENADHPLKYRSPFDFNFWRELQ